MSPERETSGVRAQTAVLEASSILRLRGTSNEYCAIPGIPARGAQALGQCALLGTREAS